MKKIKGVAALILVICLLATMLPLPFVTAVAEENSEAVLTGIDIVSLPRKTEYFTGETLDTAGLTVVAFYSDGSTVEMNEGFTVSGFNSAVTGEQTLTVTYMGATATFPVTVNQLEVTGIDLVSLPRKTEYFTGEALDTAGLTLVAFYSDGSTVEINEGFTVSGFNSTVTGEQTLTVTYMGATATFAVTVNELEVTGIEIVIEPAKKEYWVGEALSTEGMVLVASYTDGSVAEITESFTVSGFNSAVAGEQMLTVTYMGATATFTVMVNQLQVIGIEVVSPPAKTKYYTGEALDTTGLVLLATYLGGTTSQITEGFTVIGFDSTLAGKQTLTVIYGEATAEFTVSVEELYLESIEISTLPVKTVYWVGETLDTTGLTLDAYYSDGSVVKITEGFTVSGFSSVKAGQKTVFVEYLGMRTFFSVTVKAPTLTAVAINTLPNKTKYYVGEKLDTTGLTLLEIYSDGSTNIVSSGFIPTGFNSSSAGTKTVVVYYKGKTTKFTVTVKINCKHTAVENGVCAQCQETIVAAVTDTTGNLLGNFITLEDALSATTEGQTLALQANAAVEDVILPSGVNLDLNGHTLTANSVLTYSSSAIIDSSEAVSGLLKIAESDGNFISTDNCQLPVYDAANSGYRFFAIDVTPCAVTGKKTGAPKYWFKLKAEKFAPLYDLICADAKLQIKVKMTWDEQENATYAAADLAFTKAWADRYSANEDIYITISVADAGNLENFKLIPMITSGDFQISGEEM